MLNTLLQPLALYKACWLGAKNTIEHDSIESGKTPFIAMDYLYGADLLCKKSFRLLFYVI